ncbi:transposase [Sphingomonas sp. 22L2VL55-3]
MTSARSVRLRLPVTSLEFDTAKATASAPPQRKPLRNGRCSRWHTLSASCICGKVHRHTRSIRLRLRHRAHGGPYALMLTPGNVSDIKAAPALLERADRMRYLLGDKGSDADSLRRSLREAGAVPVISGRGNRKRTIRYDKQRYCGRHLVKNAFCRLKGFRRVATRYDKLVANFLSAVVLATAVAF